jgi:hypothetical protein
MEILPSLVESRSLGVGAGQFLYPGHMQRPSSGLNCQIARRGGIIRGARAGDGSTAWR